MRNLITAVVLAVCTGASAAQAPYRVADTVEVIRPSPLAFGLCITPEGLAASPPVWEKIFSIDGGKVTSSLAGMMLSVYNDGGRLLAIVSGPDGCVPTSDQPLYFYL